MLFVSKLVRFLQDNVLSRVKPKKLCMRNVWNCFVTLPNLPASRCVVFSYKLNTVLFLKS